MFRLPLTRVLGLVAGAALLACTPAARADYSEEQYKADLKLFEDAKLSHQDADLLDFFRKRLVKDEDRERIEGLIKKFSSKSFKERTQATEDIVKEGPPALPQLRKMLQGNAELEIKRRAEECIKAIEKKSPNALVMAAARLLKQRRVPGAGAVLLEYVPVAPDENVEEEVFASIFGLAMLGAQLDVLPPVVKAGTLDPLLVQALNDKEPARRAIAALVVGRYGDATQRKEVAKLLADKELAVRFRAAQGLVCGRDASGLPVLVELLNHGPLPLALQAEDLLSLVAAEKGPTAPLGESTDLRQKCHDAWKSWYDENKAKLDLTQTDIDSPFGSMTNRASNGAMQFIKSLLKFDPVLIAKVTDVPFSFAGVLNFNTREEFDNFVKMIKDQPPPQDFKFKVRSVIPAAEYLKNAPENERNFLEASRPSQVHIVYVDLQEGNRNRQDSLPLFIRISGGRARCIGFGNPRGGGAP
jgi:HEAT repeat protein